MASIVCQIDDIIFNSIADAAKYYGLNKYTVRSRLDHGWTLRQSLGIDAPNEIRAYNTWLINQSIEEKRCWKCRKQKPLSNFYKMSDKYGRNNYTAECKNCMIKTSINNNKLRKYGINKEQIDIMLKNQNNRCAICKKKIERSKDSINNIYIDHDHKMGNVRGLLCLKCNSVLGYAKDNIETLKTAIKYLKGIL